MSVRDNISILVIIEPKTKIDRELLNLDKCVEDGKFSLSNDMITRRVLVAVTGTIVYGQTHTNPDFNVNVGTNLIRRKLENVIKSVIKEDETAADCDCIVTEIGHIHIDDSGTAELVPATHDTLVVLSGINRQFYAFVQVSAPRVSLVCNLIKADDAAALSPFEIQVPIVRRYEPNVVIQHLFGAIQDAHREFSGYALNVITGLSEWSDSRPVEETLQVANNMEITVFEKRPTATGGRRIKTRKNRSLSKKRTAYKTKSRSRSRRRSRVRKVLKPKLHLKRSR